MRLYRFEDGFTIFFKEALHAWQREADFAHGHFGCEFLKIRQATNNRKTVDSV